MKRTADDPCKRCGAQKATHLVDIRAVVTLVERLCTRCCNKMLIKYPASSAVAIREYEQ